MKRIGLLALAVLAGLAPAWAGEPQRTFTVEDLNRDIARERAKDPWRQRSYTLSCWEGGALVFQERDVTLLPQPHRAMGDTPLTFVRKDGRKIIVYPMGGLCVREEQ